MSEQGNDNLWTQLLVEWMSSEEIDRSIPLAELEGMTPERLRAIKDIQGKFRWLQRRQTRERQDIERAAREQAFETAQTRLRDLSEPELRRLLQERAPEQYATMYREKMDTQPLTAEELRSLVVDLGVLDENDSDE